jgi:hypothetical protein
VPLITCPDCGKDVSAVAPVCIHCGRPFAPSPDAQPAGSTRIPSAVAQKSGAGARVLIAFASIVMAVTLLYLALFREGAAEKDRLIEGAQMATLKLATVGSWEDQYYSQQGKFAWLYEVRNSLPHLESMSVMDWMDVGRGVEVRTSIDGKAYMVEASVPEFGVACAMYQRRDAAVLATNADAPVTSRIYDMLGWPNDLNAIDCRRTRFPWPLLHWAGAGYLSSDEVMSGLRAVTGRVY